MAEHQSKMKWFTTAKLMYLLGLAVLVITVVLEDILNPSKLRGHSRFVDGCEGPLFIFSFILCLLAPFFAHRPWLVRCGFFIAGLLGYAVFVVILAAVDMVFTGLPPH